MTDYLYDHKESLVRGRDILELGAGAGLPSIAAAIWGAKNVVVTDYPDEDLVENMMINVDAATDVFPSSSSIIAVQVSSSGTLNAYGLGRLKAIVSRDMSGAPMPNLFLQICRLVVVALIPSFSRICCLTIPSMRRWCQQYKRPSRARQMQKHWSSLRRIPLGSLIKIWRFSIWPDRVGSRLTRLSSGSWTRLCLKMIEETSCYDVPCSDMS